MLAPPVPISIVIPKWPPQTGPPRKMGLTSPIPKSTIYHNNSNCIPFMTPITKSPLLEQCESCSPIQMQNTSPIKKETVTQYSTEQSMLNHNYIAIKKISKTLQGCIWEAISATNRQKCIIKVTSINLHCQSLASINGKQVNVKENIIKEASILKYLTINNAPKELAKYIDFFMDKTNYFLVMENGGTSLFDFVKESHQCIIDGILTIKEWQTFCKIALKQMVRILEWMHNAMKCCHLDLSLENWVITDVMVVVNKKNKICFSHDFQVKLIDFGLSEVFESKNNKNGDLLSFKCSKFVGKQTYKSPEICAKHSTFDARLADVWSLGIVLFSMITGGILCQKACKNDAAFTYVISGHLLDVIESYNRIHYVNADIFNLMSRIFRYEKYRINMKEIKNHNWLKN